MTLHKNRRIATAPLLVVALAAVLTLAAAHVETHPLASSVQASGTVEGLMASTPVLSYQGRLLDPITGAPKPDGSYTMSFNLYEVETFGSPLWTETKRVAVGGGLFSTLLGDTSGLNLAIFDGRSLWLGVTVGADGEATPRMPIAYTAYALRANRAGDADTVEGQPASNFALTTHIHDTRYYPQQDSDSRFINDNPLVGPEVDNRDIADGALAPGKIAGGAWTSANDGSGSGLDADLLDSQHGSSYAPAVHGHWGNTWTGSGTGLTLSGGATGLDATAANGPGVVGRSSLNNGVNGYSDGGSGVQGHSKDGNGVRGESVTSEGGFFTSDNDNLDLTLGGGVGRINTDFDYPHSDLVLSSNRDVVVRLDNDSGEDAFFRVKNSGGVDVFTVSETGVIWPAGLAHSTAQEQYFSVSSEDFVLSTDLSYGTSEGCGDAHASASGINTLVAPVHLPQGAKVTRFEVFFGDTAAGDLTVVLYAQYLKGCNFPPLAEVTSSGTADYFSLTDATIASPAIDNTSNAYHIKALATTSDGVMPMIKGAVVTYTISEAP